MVEGDYTDHPRTLEIFGQNCTWCSTQTCESSLYIDHLCEAWSNNTISYKIKLNQSHSVQWETALLLQ